MANQSKYDKEVEKGKAAGLSSKEARKRAKRLTAPKKFGPPTPYYEAGGGWREWKVTKKKLKKKVSKQKQTTRTKQVSKQLKTAGLTDAEIERLAGKRLKKTFSK